ncbi:MAG: ABC transporter permease [Kiritimatiellae bacterium]|nr:ABC transporter permease [Kiritimatiellia bacterium]
MKRLYLILLRKELASAVHTSAAALVAAVVLSLSGFVAWLQVLRLSDGRAADGFWARPEPLFWLVLLLSAPLLTMHFFSEERRTGELELRLAAPVSEACIVLSKYSAALLFWLLAWLPVLFYPLFFRLAGFPPGAAPRGAPVFYLGIQLLGASFLAYGLFVSLLTRRPLVAAMLAVAPLAALVALGMHPAPDALAFPPALRATLSPVVHLRDFSTGVVDSRPVVAHLATAGLFLFLSTRLLEARRAA